MASTKPRVAGKLPPDVKKALAMAVERAKSQSKVAEQLNVSTAVISTLLKDKYAGNVETMAQRIRGQYMAETVRCPVLGTLSTKSCLDNQALPMAFTNPVRAALGRSCKTCPHRKELS
jgi:fructose 1,6-bisphosphatase